MFGGKMGALEIIVILVIVLIIFGPKQLPKLAKMFGKTVSGFKKGMEDDEDDVPGDGEAKTESAAAAQEPEKKDAAENKDGE